MQGYERVVLSGDRIEYKRYSWPVGALPWGRPKKEKGFKVDRPVIEYTGAPGREPGDDEIDELYGILSRRNLISEDLDQIREDDKKQREPDLVEKIENRVRNLGQARKKVGRLIECNKTADDVFLTLTFADNVQDLDRANYEFKKFRQRLEYKLGKKLKYVVIIEFQERGAVHYHTYIFGIGFVDWKLYEKTWGHGWIRVNHVDDSAGPAAYVTAYMVKDMSGDTRTMGRKCYFCSRGLKQPVEVDNTTEEGRAIIAGLVECIDMKWSAECQSAWLGDYYSIVGKVVRD